MKFLQLVLALGWLSTNRADAHGDVHERLASASAGLAQAPDDVQLLIRRGELHREHGDYGAALADFDRAGKLDAKVLADFFKGRVLADAHFPREARVRLDRHLLAHPSHAEARLVRAGVLAELRDPRAAAADYSVAIASSRAPQPDHYVARARLLASLGGPAVDEAVGGLIEGMKRLGPLVSLQQEAMELELARKHFDPALKWIDVLAAGTSRKDIWLAKRGEVLLLAGRTTEARAAFAAALEQLEKLSPRQRALEMTVALEKQVRESLARLSEITARNAREGGQ